jgi:predicted N-acetyltransferase YhbS
MGDNVVSPTRDRVEQAPTIDNSTTMASPLHIRRMRVDDLPAVLALQSLCYTALEPESECSLRAKLRASESTCTFAVIGNTPVGYLFAFPSTFADPPELDATTCALPEQPDCLHLHDLAVSPHARGTGAGQALVEAFFAALDAAQLPRASLVAVQGTVPYWGRRGFRVMPARGVLRARLATYGGGARYMVR